MSATLSIGLACSNFVCAAFVCCMIPSPDDVAPKRRTCWCPPEFKAARPSRLGTPVTPITHQGAATVAQPARQLQTIVRPSRLRRCSRICRALP
jgi:hypothetical protein